MIIEPDTERSFTRIHFDRQASLEFINNTYDHCRIQNLSLTGMFVKGDFHQQVNQKCLIDLVQSGASTDLSLQATARVVRKDEGGIAVEFTSMPFDSYVFLQSTLLCEVDERLAGRNKSPENYPFKITDTLPKSGESDISFH